jgi:hypothetical protein
MILLTRSHEIISELFLVIVISVCASCLGQTAAILTTLAGIWEKHATALTAEKEPE